MKNLSYLFLFILILTSCSSPQEENKDFVEIDGNKIPIINLAQVDEEPTTIGWSTIFDDVEIIPLETDEKCMIMNWMTGLSPNSLYLATQTGGVGPVRLMEFDLSGNYIRDFGAGGKGPGEHTGYMLLGINYYKEYNSVLADFGGLPTENHLFKPDGEFIGEVKSSLKLGSKTTRLGEDLFITLGVSYGKPNYNRDSVLLEWHDRRGRKIKSVIRAKYPPKSDPGFTPVASSHSLYKYKNEWHFFSPGNDTIYKIKGNEIDPIGIFRMGESYIQLNQIVNPREVIGRFNIEIFTENEEYWILKKSTVTVCDVKEYRPGSWGGMWDFDESFIFIRKDNQLSYHIQFDDDLLGIISREFMKYFFHWDDSGRYYMVVDAISLIEFIDKSMSEGKVPEPMNEIIIQLRESINENSNPVLFMFKERKKYKLD